MRSRVKTFYHCEIPHLPVQPLADARGSIAGMKKALAFIWISLMIAFPAAAADNPDFTLKKIGDGVYAAISGDDSKAGSNAGFIVGSNCIVVVDTFEKVEAARELLAAIRKVTNLPVRYVVNTHYHLDHTGGNAVFRDAGATIIAQRNVRDWLRTENLKFFGANPKPEQKAEVEGLVLPDLVYSDALDIYAGSRLVQVRYMLGHTGGDSVVLVPDANVVFGGDLVWQKHLPNLIDASTAAWIKTLDTLLAQHPTVVFVSGHGDLAGAADLHDFRQYLVTLRADVAQAQAQGKSGNELVKAITAELKPTYGQWGFFDYFIAHNIEQTADELAGRKKIPQPASQ
jgi:glyoxylase-like metal-dependent hydrolase (beta-lactamase superfamily II)